MSERRYDLSCLVDPYRSGWTLEKFLAHRFRYHPIEIWRDRIAEGAVRVNGEPATGEAIVTRDDRVEYTFLHTEPAVDFRYEVLFEDRDLLAVAKSGNLPVHAGGKFIENTLIARLRPDFGDELRLAHRLDRETSGVVLLARSAEAARRLEPQFRERTVGKSYVAVLRGDTPAEWTVDAPIARAEPAEPPYFRVVDPESGKPACTSFRRLLGGSSPAGPISLVEVRPRSGRTNQIRVHAAHTGDPVLGDKIYGVSPDLAREFVRDGESPRILEAAGARRHLLHCARLEVRHPADDRRLVLEAAVPADFRDLWNGPDEVALALQSGYSTPDV